MSPARPDPAAFLSRLLLAGALACLAVLTLLDRGATRGYASPWVWLFWFAHAAPLAALAARGLSPRAPLVLPSRPWLLLAAVSAAIVAASAALAPFRGPAVLAALTPFAALAAFLLLHDWLAAAPSRRATALSAGGLFLFVVVAVSLARWVGGDLVSSGAFHDWRTLLEHRNPHPLGHSNYTAGLALLAFAWLGALAWHTRGASRLAWLFAAALALLALFSSGSRGGLIGLAVLGLAAILLARLRLRTLLVSAVGIGVAAAAFAVAHPRTRAMIFSPRAAASAPNLSNVQRAAMLQAGLRMAADRPLLGWGPGSTPRLYPRYRAGLDGGAENVLQLHSTPIQFLADLGASGLACAVACLGLALAAAVRAARDEPGEPLARGATLALAGYAAFALTDSQLDVPVFAFAVAACAAILAATAPPPAASRAASLAAGLAALATLAVVAAFGRPDPAPALNVRALALARDPAQADRAVALLRSSLALDPDQEIAHFNLGWLLVVRDAPAAERHFLAAAHLVPDKGGVYFGLGLARLNQGRRADAARAFALECLDDPLFLTSPWWRTPEIAALRADTVATLPTLAATAAAALSARRDPRARDVLYVATLAAWLDGRATPGDILARAHTPKRVSFFAARPAVPDFADAPARTFRRERTGYPVLMRDLDLPPPVDLFDVQENTLAASDFAFLFPPKGWLPAPLLLALLDSPNPPH